MGRPGFGRAGGIFALGELIRGHRRALEADLIRFGLRLRWLGRRPDFVVSDLLALVHALARDETSALWRSLNPKRPPAHERLMYDAVNLSLMQVANFRQAHGDKKAKFEPLYVYFGGPWETEEAPQIVPAGGFVVMTPEEAERWRAEHKASLKPAPTPPKELTAGN